MNNLPVPTSSQKEKYLSSLPVPTEDQKKQYVSLSALPVPPETPSATPLQKEEETRSFWDRPVLGAEYTTPAEIAEIAQRHKVDPKELESLAPYFGARMKDAGFVSESEAKRAVGEVGQVLLGIPQKLYKKYRGGSMEGALDELQQLASGRQSYTQLAGEVAVPGVGVGTQAATKAGKLVGMATTGAIAGAAAAPAGHEIEGAEFGAGLTAAGAAGARLLKKPAAAIARWWRGPAGEVAEKVAGKVESEAAPPEIKYLKSNEARIEDGTQELLARRADSEKIIESTIFEGTPLTDETARTIVTQQIPEERLSRLLNRADDEGAIIAERAAQENRTPQQVLANDVVNNRIQDLADDITGSRPASVQKAYEAVQEATKSVGGERAAREQYQQMVQGNTALDYITENSVRVSPVAGRGLRMATDALSDAQFVLRSADEKMGTAIEPDHHLLNRAYNRFTIEKDGIQSGLEKLHKDAVQSGVDDTIVNTDRLYHALDTGDLSSLSAPEQKSARAFQEFFSSVRERANSMVGEDVTPLSIPKVEHYVPHQTLAPAQATLAFENKMGEVLAKAQEATGRQLADIAALSQKEFDTLKKGGTFQELIAGLKLYDNKEISSARDLLNRFKEITTPGTGYPKLETVANAAISRTGDIPDFLREKNLYKLADRWTNNTFRHIYLRKPLDKLRRWVPVLERAGAEVESRYLKRLIGDVVGTRPLSGARAASEINLKYQRGISSLVNRVGGKETTAGQAVNSLSAMPYVMQAASRQIYPNLLGFSPRALLMNLTQSYVKTAPELGTTYGYATVTRGAVNALLNLRKYVKEVERQGLAPASFTQKGRDAIAEGIQRSSLYKIPGKTLQALGDAGMFLYSRMDTLNRAITLGTAEQMSYDLLRGSKAAYKALGKLPTSLQRNAAAAIRSEDQKALSRLIVDHLNASTQYNYNRLSLSEFGRVLGPTFSTFSKWPTATAGEILGEMKDRGVARGSVRAAEKYLAPYMLLAGVGYLVHGDPEEMSDRKQKVFGKADLTSASPLGALQSMATGDFFTPPAVDAVWGNFVVPAIKGDEPGVTKGIASTIQNFAPGSGVVRFLTDDMVTYITGQRPEGNFLEKTQEGLQRITK